MYNVFRENAFAMTSGGSDSWRGGIIHQAKGHDGMQEAWHSKSEIGTMSRSVVYLEIFMNNKVVWWNELFIGVSWGANLQRVNFLEFSGWGGWLDLTKLRFPTIQVLTVSCTVREYRKLSWIAGFERDIQKVVFLFLLSNTMQYPRAALTCIEGSWSWILDTSAIHVATEDYGITSLFGDLTFRLMSHLWVRLVGPQYCHRKLEIDAGYKLLGGYR